MNRVRVTLPYHLRNLAKVDMEVELQVPSPVTQRSILSSLEAAYPVLVGTTRDSITHRRRPLVRFFA